MSDRPLAPLSVGLQAKLIASSFHRWADSQDIPKAVRERALEDVLRRRTGDTKELGGGLAMLAVGYNEFEEAVKRAEAP